MIFNLVLAKTWRPGQLYNLEMSNIQKVKKKGEFVFHIKSRIRTTSVASKNQQGDLEAVNEKPSCVLYGAEQLGGIHFHF